MKLKNIILITIDALRADHLGCYGYERNTSPNIDRLAKEGILFKKAIANAPYTTASITALQTSTYPLIPERNYTDLSKRLTLAEVLNKAGFFTIGVHSNPWFSIYNYDKGFIKFVDPMNKTNTNIRKRFLSKIKKLLSNYISENSLTYKIVRKVYSFIRKEKLILPYARAENINDTVISCLKDLDKEINKFYLWIHYMDVHEPYIPEKFYFSHEISNEETKKLMNKVMYNHPDISFEERKTIVDLYDNKIKYLDYRIGELLVNLEKLCDLDKTLLIVTGDHGEALGERGYFGHGGRGRSIIFFDEMLHVPLIIWSRSKENLINFYKSGEFERQVGLIDIAPTILDMLGIEKPKTFMGESLLRNPFEKPIISQGIQCIDPNQAKYFKEGVQIHSYRTNYYKLIYREDGHIELYDLEKDPVEMQNIAKDNPEVVTKLRKQLFEFIESLKQKSGVKEVVEKRGKGKKEKYFEEDEELIKERLRALGYLE